MKIKEFFYQFILNIILRFFESQMSNDFDETLSRKIDCLNFVIEN